MKVKAVKVNRAYYFLTDPRILSKGPINYISQTKNLIYPVLLHTKQIIQTQSSQQMSMLTSSYGMHQPKAIEENWLNNSNQIT